MTATHARALPPAPASRPRTAPGGARSSGGQSRSSTEQNPRRRRRHRNPQKSNPADLGMLGLIGIGLAATAVGYFGYREIRRRRHGKMLATSLDDAIMTGATLAGATDVVADIEQPIALTTQPIAGYAGYSLVPDLVVHAPGTMSAADPVRLRSVEFGSDAGGGYNELAYSGRTMDGAEFNGVAPQSSDKAIAALVVNVAPAFASKVYGELKTAMAKGTVDWNEPTVRDQLIAATLKNTVPSVDWSRGLEPYAYGSPQGMVWGAVQLLGAIADQTYWNKRLAQEGG